MKKVVIFGACSGVAKAVLRLAASRGDRLFLVARDPERLAAVAEDLRIRYRAEVSTFAADLVDEAQHGKAWDAAEAFLVDIDSALIAYGELGQQRLAEESSHEASRILRVNFSSVAALLTEVAKRFHAQGRGTIAVLSSVAGERGRRSNYVYGSAKGGLSIFLSGLRHRFYGTDVRVFDVRLGQVDTPMTAGFRKGPLWAQPEKVSPVIIRALDAEQGLGGVVYAPGLWRWIMLAVRNLPEDLFNRLNL